jgi:DNA-binding SARP family transcriptional activator/uncharacterized protein HemY
MRLGILGPLLVADDGGNQITVAAARQRTLLAALVVRANRTVPVEELAELVWDTAPPGGAARTLRSYVMRLRHVVGPAVAARIVTRDPGYRCEVAEAELDVLRFEALCRQGGAAVRARAWQQGRRLLAEALGLWRGAALEDILSQSLRQECIAYLEQARLRAIEWRIEADLHLGRHEELIPELQALADRYPLREHGHAQLMLALYRCERPAEALAAFQRARRLLVQEVGIEPGPELRTLQEKILAGDAELTAPPQDDVPTTAAGHTPIVTQPQLSSAQRVPPRELPPTVPGFTARSAELEALTRLLNRPGEQAPGTVVISAIGGTAGVGKTALAVHWAHQVAENFPDGQLYVNLRGFDLAQPVTAAEALAGFLRALGGAGQIIPPTEAERAARYRSLLAGRRMLVLLDNARDARQVRPLLPGNPGCLALVTSRSQLAGLAAVEGAYLLTLDLLTEAEARELLAQRLGEARLNAEPQAATQLIRLCARLPLALAVAAARASAQPTLSLGALATELNDAGRRLDALDTGGDDPTAVRAVFSWSYRQLDPGTARAFRLMGLHPGPDLDAYATAALTATTLRLATQQLGQLARAHLIQPTCPGRYGTHDLLRGYSRELAGTCDGESAQQAALTTLFDYYTYTAALAMDTAFPAERHRRPAIQPPATAAPAFSAAPAALAWLDAELPALVAATGVAARHGWPYHATRLAAILFRYLDTASHFSEAITIHSHARRAARRTGDRAAEADALTGLGLVHGHQGRHLQATRQFRQALARYGQADSQVGQARALNYLGLVYGQQGNYPRASSDLQRAAALYQAAGERTGEAHALSNLGVLALRQGCYRQAVRHQQEALALLATMQDRHGQATVLERLGFIALQQGRYQQATSQLQQAQTRYRTIGDQQGQASAQAKLGVVKLRQGHYRQATSEFQQALARYRQLADPSGQAIALNGLGEVFLATAHPSDARSHHAAAAALAAQASDTYELAHAQRGLACAWQACGDPCEAHRHWYQALTLYALLGAPEADQIRAQLTATNIAPFAESRQELGNQNKALCSRNCRTPAAPKRHPIGRSAIGGG